MSILLKQFTQGSLSTALTSYIKVMGMKTPKVINNVIEEGYDNLFNSTQAFIDGLVSLDRDFIESTSTLALQKVLLPQIDKLKAKNTSINILPEKAEDATKDDKITPKKMFTISPYVIFGQNMEKRSKLEKPWKYTAPIFATNRFVAADEIEGISLSKIWNQHIYGFHCFVFDKRRIEVTQGISVEEHTPKNFVVSFETDAQNHEFFVSDFNWLVKYNN